MSAKAGGLPARKTRRIGRLYGNFPHRGFPTGLCYKNARFVSSGQEVCRRTVPASLGDGTIAPTFCVIASQEQLSDAKYSKAVGRPARQVENGYEGPEDFWQRSRTSRIPESAFHITQLCVFDMTASRNRRRNTRYGAGMVADQPAREAGQDRCEG